MCVLNNNLFVKLKKLQWIRKPEKIKITSSHSMSITTEHDSALVYTFEENEKVNVTIKSNELSYGLGVIFNQDQGMMLIKKDSFLEKTTTFMGLTEVVRLNLIDENQFSFEKSSDEIIFSNGNSEVVRLKFKTIKESVSISILLFGKGSANISF